MSGYRAQACQVYMARTCLPAKSPLSFGENTLEYSQYISFSVGVGASCTCAFLYRLGVDYVICFCT